MLDCVGLVWVDVFFIVGGEVVIKEINILFGFICISMYFKLWVVSGLGYIVLIICLLELVMVWYVVECGL